MPSKKSRSDNLAADQSMIDGLQKNASRLPASFPVGRQTMTPADLVQVFQGRVTTSKAVVVADAARAAAVKADRDRRTQTKPAATAFRSLVIAMFQESPDILGDFGLAAPKVGVKTAEVKASAAAKSRATKAAKNRVPATPAPQVAPAVKPAS